MVLVVDASNIRLGGGVTHLQEVLQSIDLARTPFRRVVVWAPASTLERIGRVPGIDLRRHWLIEKGGAHTYWFRKRVLDTLIEPHTTLLWVPGGTCLAKFRPFVTMARNLLPFEKRERDRFRYSATWWRYHYLRRAQLESFRRSEGIIHVSDSIRDAVNQQANLGRVRQVTIHHGLSTRFHYPPRDQRELSSYTREDPVRVLYVSPINLYKHQDKLVESVAMLRSKGLPMRLDLVGPAFSKASSRLDRVLAKHDPSGEWTHLHGAVPYDVVASFYQEADVYACMSTCESFGMVLLEAMGAGLPILSSNRCALPEIHGGTCPSVNPEDVQAVSDELERFLRDVSLRREAAQAAFDRARGFSWCRCAEATFAFLADCARPARGVKVLPPTP